MLFRIENQYCHGLKCSGPQVQRLKGRHQEDIELLETFRNRLQQCMANRGRHIEAIFGWYLRRTL